MDAPVDWAALSDEQLLECRIAKLGLRLDGTALEPLIKQFYDELSAKGLVFHPPCHIGDEWFVPVGIPAIFVPFFLVHERLRALERKMMLEVEGETPDYFMKLIRHETAHAYNYAYHLPHNKRWAQIFGQTSDEETPDTYRPRPFSRSYVVHLDDWYAQSHPDEDFAETFAVWLTPDLDWRKRYAGWKALQKLEYVDELMRGLAGKPPLHTPKYRVAEYNCLNRRLLNAVCQWTNEKKYRVNELLTRLIERCDQLGLRVHNDDPQQDFRISAFITTLVMNYLFTGKFKRTK